MTLPPISYIIDQYGQKTGVQIPWEDWQNLMQMFRRIAIEQGHCFALAQETWDDMITEGKKYAVILQKDEDFPEGEECVVGDNGELITLYFKHEILFDNGQNI